MEARKSDIAPAGLHTFGNDQTLRERVAVRYDRCHPDDSFQDLVRRSSFSREDRRLLEDWLETERSRSRH